MQLDQADLAASFGVGPFAVDEGRHNSAEKYSTAASAVVFESEKFSRELAIVVVVGLIAAAAAPAVV